MWLRSVFCVSYRYPSRPPRAMTAASLGSCPADSGPYCFSTSRRAASGWNRAFPPFSIRQLNFSFSSSVSSFRSQAPSFRRASAGENRPSSFITWSVRSGPE